MIDGCSFFVDKKCVFVDKYLQPVKNAIKPSQAVYGMRYKVHTS